MIYFDNAATTKPRKEVLQTYTGLLEEFGNPDSLHQLGRKAGKLVEKSRSNIAGQLGVLPEEILFTSCASESNSLAIIGYALANQSRGKHVITSNAEHSSSEHAMDFLERMGFEVTRLPIGADGKISLEDLKKALRKDTILVSLIHVNNEMGAIHPAKEIAELVHENSRAAFHLDATQSFTKLDLPFADLDLMSASAHKIHGLKGSALLLKKKNIRLEPLIQGGQQEQGLRGGTTNTPTDIVLAKTIRLAMEEKKDGYEKVREIRDYIAREVEAMGGEVLSPPDGIPYILNIALKTMTSEVLQNALDQRGIYISARSTCKSSQSGANPILMKMGVDQKDALKAIRLSFSADNTMEEARQFIDNLREINQAYGLSI